MSSEGSYWRRGAAISITAGIGGFAASYTLNVVVARLLPPHDYGDFKVAMVFVMFATIFVILGGNEAAPRFLSGWVRTSDRTGVWEYVRLYLLLAGGLSLIVIAVTVMISFAQVEPTDLTGHHPLVFAVFVLPIAAASALLDRVFQAARRLDLATLPWRIGFPLLNLILIASIATLTGVMTDIQAILLTMIGSTALIAFQLLNIRRLSLIPLRRAPALATPNVWLRASVPMMLVVVLQLGVEQVDILMVEILAGESDVGHFAAAATTIGVIKLVGESVASLTMPMIAESLKEGRRQTGELYIRAFRLLFVISLPVAVGVAVFGREILGLFGPTYEVAYPALLILVVGALIGKWLSLPALWLQYAGHERTVLIVMSVAMGANIVLNAILIPTVGITGAAVATASSVMTSAFVLSLIMRHRLGISPWPIGALLGLRPST